MDMRRGLLLLSKALQASLQANVTATTLHLRMGGSTYHEFSRFVQQEASLKGEAFDEVCKEFVKVQALLSASSAQVKSSSYNQTTCVSTSATARSLNAATDCTSTDTGKTSQFCTAVLFSESKGTSMSPDTPRRYPAGRFSEAEGWKTLSQNGGGRMSREVLVSDADEEPLLGARDAAFSPE